MTGLGHRDLARRIAHQPVVVLPDEDGAEQGHSDRPTEPAEEVRRCGEGTVAESGRSLTHGDRWLGSVVAAAIALADRT